MSHYRWRNKWHCRYVVVGFKLGKNEAFLSSVLLSAWSAVFPKFCITYRLSGVGCRVSVVGCNGVDCQLRLSVQVVCCWLFGVRLSNADCRYVGCLCRWFLLVPGCQVSVVGCRLSVVKCRVSVVGRWLFVQCLCRLSFSFPLKVSSPALTFNKHHSQNNIQ